MMGLRPTELIIILLIIVLLFGAKKLPETARGLGRSLRIFKAEVKDMHDDDQPASTTSTSTAQLPPTPPVSPAPTVSPPPVTPQDRTTRDA